MSFFFWFTLAVSQWCSTSITSYVVIIIQCFVLVESDLVGRVPKVVRGWG
jgi:hypothetical protein